MPTTRQPIQLELFPTLAYSDPPRFDLMPAASTLFDDWSTIREWRRSGAPKQLELFPTAVRLIKIVPARNQWRFYLMQALPTLFGDWTLAREWGRIGAPGRVNFTVVGDTAFEAKQIRRVCRNPCAWRRPPGRPVSW